MTMPGKAGVYDKTYKTQWVSIKDVLPTIGERVWVLTKWGYITAAT